MIDAFDDDISDDFFNVVFSEETEKALEKIENVLGSRPSGLVIFDCLGEANCENIELSRNGYYRNFENLFSVDDDVSNNVSLFDKVVNRGSCLQLLLDDLFFTMAEEFMALDSVARATFGTALFSRSDTGKNYFDERKHCVEFFWFVLRYIRRFNDTRYRSSAVPSLSKISLKLISLDYLLGNIRDLPNHVKLFCANSSGNKCFQASYHLLHSHLDFRLLHLLLVHATSQARLNAGDVPPDCFILDSCKALKTTEALFRQLFYLSIIRFNKIDINDLAKRTPFGCTCEQELWLVLHKLVSSDDDTRRFWSYIDSLINLCFVGREETSESGEDELQPTKPLIFSVWFLYHIGRLSQYNKQLENNYQLLENILKQAVSCDISEVELRTLMCFLENICVDLWDPKSEPILILWEYYQKRLNESFYVIGHKLDSCSVIAKDGRGLLESARNLLEEPCAPRNSFEKFLRIIGLHLKRSSTNPRHWNIIKGRVYSKVTLPRIVGLTATGEHHAVILLVLLALCGNATEVSNRMSELLEGCLKGKGVSEELFKGGLAIALLLVERHSPLHGIAPVLVSIVQTPSNQPLSKLLVSSLSDLVDAPLSLGQHLLFDKWLSDHLSSNASRLIDVILSLTVSMSTCEPTHDHIVMVEKLWPSINSYVLSHISDVSTPVQIADISLNLAILFHKLSEASRRNEIFALFLRNDSCDIRLARRFVCSLLQSGIHVPDMNSLVIKIWIRNGLVCQDINHEEVKLLSYHVSQMKEIQGLCYGRVSDIIDSEEPLLEFVMSISAKFESVEDIFQRQKLRECVNMYMGGIEKWVKPLLIQPLLNLDSVERVFFLIGNIVRLVAPLLYQKSKPNSIIQALLNITVLPLSVHNPEVKINSFVLSAARKSLHLFIEGLLKLNPQSDHYINRSIKELISVYVPRCLANSGAIPSHLQISSFSLITLFNEFSTGMAEAVLTILCEAFLKSKSRNPHQNALQVIIFIREIVKLHGFEERVLVCVLKFSFKQVICTMMFCDEKTVIYSTIKDLVTSIVQCVGRAKSDVVKESAIEVLTKFTKENIVWTSRQVIDVLCFIANHSPELIKSFSPSLLKCIQEVESLRGVGYDKLLRLGYEKIQSRLMSGKENIR